MPYRVAVLHQGFVPLYRVRLYEQLNALGSTEYVVFHGRAPSGTGHVAAPGPFAFPNVYVDNRELSLGGRTLIWQPVIRSVLTGGFDAAVIGDEFKLLANLAIFMAFKALHRPVLLWGHVHRRPDAHWLARASAGAFAGMADGYLAYTAGGATRLIEGGMPADKVFVVRNTVDLAAQIASHARLRSAPVGELKRKLGLREDAQVLLYVGRLYARKRCCELIELVRRLKAGPDTPPVDLVIVGEGPEGEALRRAAAGQDNIHFFGAIHCPTRIGELMRAASLMVNPGSIGLSVNDSFAHGVPVVTQAGMLHSPEFEYIRDGYNGLIAEGGLDAFVAAVRRVLVDPGLRARLAEGALATRDQLGLGYMVSAFDRGVIRTIERMRTPSVRSVSTQT